MITLIIGKENSGKSELAEELAMRTGDPVRYYLATMKICDDAAEQRVQRHRAKREGKGFVTIEQPYDLMPVTDRIERAGEATLLLECVSNLVGNEMHDHPEHCVLVTSSLPERERFAEEVSAQIRSLAALVHNLIIVTNAYEPDGPGYDEDTRLYVELLNMVNDRLIPLSDHVVDLTDRAADLPEQNAQMNFSDGDAERSTK